MKISKKNDMGNQVIFIDGLPGCGKTLFSPIVSSMKNVEQYIFSYEVEQYCGLYILGNMNLNSTSVMIKEALDLRIYNLMMSREVNFRPSDLSSVTKYHNPSLYEDRLSSPGDEDVVREISEKKPILNVALHQSLAFSEPIWEALGNRCSFIEIVRHPAYMIEQQSVNFETVAGCKRDFDLQFLYQGKELPYFAFGWEEDYIKSTSIEKSINFIYHHAIKTENLKSKIQLKYPDKILTIPFEKFVINPMPWLSKIEIILNTQITEKTEFVMSQQRVPRLRISDGIDLDIYKRFGWKPPKDNISDEQELLNRKNKILENVNKECSMKFEEICNNYERKFNFKN